MCDCFLAVVPFQDFFCLFGLSVTVTELENAAVSKVFQIIAAAEHGCFILLERQTYF